MSPFSLNQKSLGLWVGGIFLLVGLPLFIVSLYLFYNDWRFSRDGRSTEGTVLAKEVRISRSDGRSDRPRRDTRHYEVSYRFTVDGKTLEGRDELSQGDWERLKERGPVGVLYLPQRPSSSRLAGNRPWLMKVMFGLLGLIFAVLGGPILLSSIRHARLEAWLRQHGVGTQGTVTELRERKLKINKVPLWRLHYEYRDYQGHPHVKSIDMLADEAEQWKVGNIGKVLYDSKRPTEAVWLGRDDGTA
jgi:hypothetical protein